jgi:hypothetical protein
MVDGLSRNGLGVYGKSNTLCLGDSRDEEFVHLGRDGFA